MAGGLVVLALTGCQVIVPHDVTIRLDHAATLVEAVAAGEDAGYDVVGFEFSSAQTYGGIDIRDETVDEALDEFRERYGTDPVVVAIVAGGQIPILARGPIVTGRDDDFTAPPIEGDAFGSD